MFDGLRQVRAGGLLGALMMVLGASATGAWGQGAGVPVLVFADDENRASVKRSSAIFKRAMGVFREGLRQRGFRMIDQESVAMGLDLEVRDRSSRREIVEIAELVRMSGKAEYIAPALVLVRIFASMQQEAPGRAALRLRMGVDFYDTRMKQFVEQFEMPERAFPVSPGCVRDRACLEDSIGKGAEEAAAALSLGVVAKLSRHLGLSSHGQPPPPAGREQPAHGRRDLAASGHGVTTPYAVTLKSFERAEALTIIGVMAEEFPGYREHTLVRSEPDGRRYVYVSTAKPGKMEEWLVILLGDMGFKVDQDVTIAIQGHEVVAEKVEAVSDPSPSDEEKQRIR